ncbi:formyl transferase [Zopfochytrium polystomum]|nr:formyl transferase [Zopfochytrium polystomum]
MSEPPRTKKQIVVLISGNGSNLQALIDATTTTTTTTTTTAATPALADTSIALVVSNKPSAYGLERAARAGIPTLTPSASLAAFKKDGKTRTDYDLALAQSILDRFAAVTSAAQQPDLLVLAGFMHVLSADFIALFPCGIVNLHPALPGQFDGAKAIERAFDAAKKGDIDRTGVMVHWVIPEVDRGEVIVKREVEIRKEDTLEDLEARIHSVEHVLIVEGVREALFGASKRKL